MTRWILYSLLGYLIGINVRGAEYELSRQSIDCGGGLRSMGGSFELSATIGQPDAGVLAGGSFALTGGFWFAITPTDCNEDGTVNLLDHYLFIDCLTGPAAGVLTSCNCFNTNHDATLDLRDFAEEQIAFSGS